MIQTTQFVQQCNLIVSQLQNPTLVGFSFSTVSVFGKTLANGAYNRYN
jgi:hypothetical protein